MYRFVNVYSVICYLCYEVPNLCCVISALCLEDSLPLEKIKTRYTNTKANWGSTKHLWHFVLQELLSWSKIMIHFVKTKLVLKNIGKKNLFCSNRCSQAVSPYSLLTDFLLKNTLWLWKHLNIWITEYVICTSRQFQEVNVNFLLFNNFLYRVQSLLLLTHLYFQDIQIKCEYLCIVTWN